MADRREAHRRDEGRREKQTAGLRPSKGSFATKLIALLLDFSCTSTLQTKVCCSMQASLMGRTGVEEICC